MASCSYDGTIRIWDSNTLKLLNVCDTNFNSLQAKSTKKIIYCISWHPELPIFCITTVNGNLMIYDSRRGKMLGGITPV